MRSWMGLVATACTLFAAFEAAGAEKRHDDADSAIRADSPFQEEETITGRSPSEVWVKPMGERARASAVMSECSDAVCAVCPEPCVMRPWHFFGEFISIRPRDVAVAYAVPTSGPISEGSVPVQITKPGIIDFDYKPGFRVGFSRAMTDCGSLGASYTYFDGSAANSISTDPSPVIRSMVIHPSTLDATGDWLEVDAQAFIKFHLVDLDYRWTFLSCDRYSMNLVAGLRYGNLQEDFRSLMLYNGAELVQSNIRFEGGGIRLGLEGERRLGCTGLSIFGRGTASFLGGSTRAVYTQDDAFAGRLVDTGWKGGRVVDILELELGLGWTSPKERLRFTAGYMFNAWQNMVKTDQFINAVQTNNFVDLGKSDSNLTFDGLFLRTELRF
jgi:hypothetical protein